MKGILFIRATYASMAGGIEGQILRIAKELASKKLFNPILITDDRDSVFAQKFQEMGFFVYEIPMGKGDIFKGARAIELLLKKHNIALIQSHMFRESLVGRWVKMKHPEILHIFRAHTYIDCSWNPDWQKIAYHVLDKLTSKYVDLYIANGKILAKEIIYRSWVSPDKIRVVINGRDQIGVPDPAGYDLDSPLPARIAMVSNLLPHKGHDVLMKSLSLLKQKGLVIHTRLIGGESTGMMNEGRTPFTEDLKKKALELGVLDELEFYGYTENVYDALKDFSVVALPSDSEGIPNCILEAICLRKLVIASGVGGIPEIIQDGANGLLHPPQDPKVLADILEKIFTTPAKEWEPMRDAGYKTWKEKFSMQQMMNGLISVYQELGVLR